jgi:hypothetical protein
MKKETKNHLLNEMMWWEDHDLFAVQEEWKIDRLSNTPEWEKITISIWNEIQKEISREEYIQWLLEKIYSKNEKDPIQWIKSFVKYCLENEKNVYNDLFSKTTGKGQEIIENEALARELLNHCLGTRWRNKWFTQSQRKLLKQELFALNQTHEGDDVFSHFISKMPASLQWVSKDELMCKVSIMMLLVAQSYPEKFAKMDEFLEKQVVIDAMLSGKTFSEMIDELLSYVWAFETKNTWLLYNYRVDDLFVFAHSAKEKLWKVPVVEKMTKKRRKQWIEKNDHELALMIKWYEELQWSLIYYHNQWFKDKELYTYCKLFTDYITRWYSTKDKIPNYLLDLRYDRTDQIDVLCFSIEVMRKKLERKFIEHYWQVKITEECLPKLDSGLVDLCLDTYDYDHKYFERILQWQQLTEMQQATLDKKRAEQEKLKNYNERLAIHRQAVRDTFEGQDDGIDRDAVFAFCNDPKNVFTMIDPNTWDISIRLPKCGPKGMKMKLMKTDNFPVDMNVKYAEKTFLPKTKSEASQELIYKPLLRTELFKHRIDTESQEWYFRDAQRFDIMMYYLAKQFGLWYNPKNMWEMQPVFRVYMAICWRVWREFLNRDKDGINWDRRWRVDNWYLDYIQIALMHDQYQKLDRYGVDISIASVMLLGDND